MFFNVNKPSLSQPIRPSAAEPAPTPAVTVAEGMRFYEAILGRVPTVDPEAPDLLPRLRDDEPPAAGWRQEMSRQVRDELARGVGARLHVRFEGRPSWRELAETMTRIAGRHLQEARRRLSGADRLGLPQRRLPGDDAGLGPSMRISPPSSAPAARPGAGPVARKAA